MNHLYTFRILKTAAVAAMAAMSIVAVQVAQSQTPPLPVLPLSEDPLFSVRSLPPNLMLNLSVEWPTTGAAYRFSTNFDPAKLYVGYFNSDRCYTYSTTNRYFVPAAATQGTNRTCSGQFSGNFLNWATMSSIDILRYALTGGNRVVDTADTTVLERTFLWNGRNYANDYRNVNDTQYFPRKAIGVSRPSGTPNPPGGFVSSQPSLYTPYSDNSVYIVNCGINIHIGTGSGSAGTACGTPNDDANLSKAQDPNGMQVRVAVCDASEGPTRKDLCTRYGNNYKPEGELQKQPLGIRVGVFGYVQESGNQRYGGVLRAKAKFVGPRQLDANLVESDNPFAEWNAGTGVFIANPDSADPNAVFPGTMTRSGVISYLNSFGSASGGNYKNNDPVGELYYESVRYLGNIGATSQATSNLSNAMYDGFPIYNWTDPVLASCQDTYSITIGDTNTHADRSLPGVSATSNNDFSRSTDSMGLDARAETQRLFTHLGSPTVPAAINADSAQPCCSNNSRYMAGIAYWAKNTGFRAKPDGTRMKMTSYFIDVQESSQTPYNQRQLYYAGIAGTFDDKNNNGRVDADEWQERNAGAAVSRTALNGGNSETFVSPLGYFLGGEPTLLIANVRKIFKQIGSNAGSLSALAFSSPVYDPSGTGLFQTALDSRRWSGKVFRFPISINAAGQLSTAAATWEAGALLDARNFATNPRQLFVARADGAGRWSGASAASTADLAGAWAGLSSAQQAALDTNPATSTADGQGQARLGYLMGIRTNEAPAGNFRPRDSRLGDIVNSGALFVDRPLEPSADASYKAFAGTPAIVSRTKMVYVGGNDGMLHAFDAATGQEAFAYVPQATFAKLNRLTDPSYAHTPFVDAPLFAGDAKTDYGSYGGWKTILAGGFGAGAQGVFALDVTLPSAFGASNILWEFTDKDDADIGYVTARPKIVKLARSTGTEWFLAVPGGYNNYQLDGASNSTGAGFLFLLSLNRQSNQPWSLGTNYFKIALPALQDTSANGLGGIGLSKSASGNTIAIYAGDLQGGLWKIDVSSNDPAQWRSAYPTGTGAPQPLARLRDAAGNLQPITSEPFVVSGVGNSKVVVVGTGRLLTSSDLSGPYNTQSVYGIWDVSGGSNVNVPNARNRLAARSVTTSTNTRTVNGADFSYGTTGTDRQGWYFDLPSSGERNVTGSAAISGLLGLTTLVPSSSACDSGSGWPYLVNPIRGKSQAAGTLITGGFPGVPAFLTGETIGTSGSTTDRATGNTRTYFLFGVAGVKADGSASGVGGSAGVAPINQASVWGVLNWREINNYQELRNNPSKGQ